MGFDRSQARVCLCGEVTHIGLGQLVRGRKRRVPANVDSQDFLVPFRSPFSQNQVPFWSPFLNILGPLLKWAQCILAWVGKGKEETGSCERRLARLPPPISRVRSPHPFYHYYPEFIITTIAQIVITIMPSSSSLQLPSSSSPLCRVHHHHYVEFIIIIMPSSSSPLCQIHHHHYAKFIKFIKNSISIISLVMRANKSA